LDELARLLSRMGYDFVSVDASGAVEIIVTRGAGTCRFTIGLVFQPLLHQIPTLLAYAFGELGLDGLLIVVPGPESLERLAPLLRDQIPAEWTGKVGVVTAPALQLLFPEYP
jgi:hypothetical protein